MILFILPKKTLAVFSGRQSFLCPFLFSFLSDRKHLPAEFGSAVFNT